MASGVLRRSLYNAYLDKETPIRREGGLRAGSSIRAWAQCPVAQSCCPTGTRCGRRRAVPWAASGSGSRDAPSGVLAGHAGPAARHHAVGDQNSVTPIRTAPTHVEARRTASPAVSGSPRRNLGRCGRRAGADVAIGRSIFERDPHSFSQHRNSSEADDGRSRSRAQSVMTTTPVGSPSAFTVSSAARSMLTRGSAGICCSL
jgi:hypothetical protein